MKLKVKSIFNSLLLSLITSVTLFSCVSSKTNDTSKDDKKTDNTNNNDNKNGNVTNEEQNNKIEFSFDKETIELDCNSNRQHLAKSDSIQGETSSCFNQKETLNIVLKLNNSNYVQDNLEVRYDIPDDDEDYFTLSANGLSVEITAIKPSRYSKINAVLVDKTTDTIIEETSCTLRSVMLNTSWIGNSVFANNKIGGEDVTGYENGYYARFFNTSYTSDLDIVFPSKIKIAGETKILNRIVGLAKTDGSDGISDNTLCRNIFIPNSVCMLSSNSLRYVCPENIIFEQKGVNYLFLSKNSLGYQSSTNVAQRKFYDTINLSNNTFPYKYYAKNIEDNAANPPKYKNLENLNDLYDNITTLSYVVTYLLKKE